jgi:hypothetical protein
MSLVLKFYFDAKQAQGGDEGGGGGRDDRHHREHDFYNIDEMKQLDEAEVCAYWLHTY